MIFRQHNYSPELEKLILSRGYDNHFFWEFNDNNIDLRDILKEGIVKKHIKEGHSAHDIIFLDDGKITYLFAKNMPLEFVAISD